MKKVSCILLSVVVSLVLDASERKISFRHLNLDNGLSSISVTDVWVDREGLVWAATARGLDCYDGNTVKRYHPSAEISQGVSDIVTRQLAGTDDGFLYVLYSTNIGVLNTRTGKFDLFLSQACNCMTYNKGLWIASKNDLLYSPRHDVPPVKILSLPLEHGEITALHHTDDGTTWIGSESGKVSVLKGGKLEVVTELFTSQIYRIYEDGIGTIWVGSLSDGAMAVSKDYKQKVYRHKPSDSKSISSNFVRDFCEDNLGNIWIGTYTGLDCLNPSTGVITRHSSQLMIHDAISHSSVWSIKKDRQGTIWVATFYGGINYFNPEYDIYDRYPVSGIEGAGLSSPIIKKVIADKSGNLWVATEGGGLNKIDRKTGYVTWYNTGSAKERRLSENNIEDMIYSVSDNAIWMGLHLGGVNSLDLTTGKIRVYRSEPKRKGSLPSDDVLSIADYGDSLIVRMKSHACIMDKRTGRCRPIRPLCEYLENGGYIRFALCDDNGNLWITKTNPCRLARLSPPYVQETEYSAENMSDGFCRSEISSLMQDKSGKIWVASMYDGIFLYNSNNDSFTSLGGGSYTFSRDALYGALTPLRQSGLLVYRRFCCVQSGHA